MCGRHEPCIIYFLTFPSQYWPSSLVVYCVTQIMILKASNKPASQLPTWGVGKGQVGWEGEKMDPLNAYFTLPSLMGSQARPATDLLHDPVSLNFHFSSSKWEAWPRRSPGAPWTLGNWAFLRGLRKEEAGDRERIVPPHLPRDGTEQGDIIMGSAHPGGGSRVG